MAMTLEDILARRTRCLFIDATETLKIAPEVAQIMATVLKMDDKKEIFVQIDKDNAAIESIIDKNIELIVEQNKNIIFHEFNLFFYQNAEDEL